MDFKKIRMEFEVIANSMLNEKDVHVAVNVDASYESYTYMKNPHEAVIQIGMGNLPLEDGFSKENRLRAQGLLFHEIGHLLYTQFEPMGIINKKESETKGHINDLLSSQKKELQSWDLTACCDLKDSLKQNIFWHELGPVLNMLEDAVVEVLMPSSTPYKRNREKIFASISAMRDYQWSEKDYPLLFNYDYERRKDDSELLKMALYEVHQFGVIGYRTQTTTFALKRVVEPEVIEELKALAFQSKFMTSSTAERYSIAKLVLKKFDKLLDKKAEKFFNALMEAVNMSDEDIENAMSSMDNTPSEISITMPNKTASSSSSQESEYNFDLSDEQKKEVENQQNEDADELNYGNDSNAENSEDGSNEDSSDEGSGGESNSDNSNDSNTHADSNKPDGAESDNQSSSSNSSSNDEDGDDSGKADETDEKSSASADDPSSNKIPLPSMEEMNKSIEKAVQKELEAEVARESENEARDVEASIKEYRRKDLNQNRLALDEYNNEFHKGITTICTNESNLDACNFSYEGRVVYSEKDTFLPVIRHCANKINKLKMYSAKAKRLNAQRRGKLNTSGLYRIGIDQKVFQKTTPGKKQNFRIAFLIDESGSMCGSKIQNAIQTAYILASACRQVKVPVSVWGHKYEYEGYMDLHKYLDFDDKSPRSLDKIFNSKASGGNQDGLAIWHVAKDLVAHRKRDEKLLLFVLSDGAPAGTNNYYGEPAEKDISHIVSLFKKEYGVESFGITIETSSCEVESCKRIYGENAIYISNSKDLPKKTVELLESLYK